MSIKINHQPIVQQTEHDDYISSSIRLSYLFSILIAILTGVASLLSLLYAATIYPTEELQQSFLSNDVVTLLIILPIMIVAMWLTQRGQLVGLLLWPGALFVGFYNYIIYLVGMPFNSMYPLYIAIVVLSIFTLISLVNSIDGRAVMAHISGRIPVKLCAGVLVFLAIFFYLFNLVTMVDALLNNTPITRPEMGLMVGDSIIAGAWLIGGILLWQKKPVGYIGGTGLLFQGSMLFIGLLVVFILQPIMGTGPFPLIDFVITFLLGLICFIPNILFLRGVL